MEAELSLTRTVTCTADVPVFAMSSSIRIELTAEPLFAVYTSVGEPLLVETLVANAFLKLLIHSNSSLLSIYVSYPRATARTIPNPSVAITPLPPGNVSVVELDVSSKPPVPV